MYDDGYRDRTGWLGALRLLNASFRIGRLFGVEIRMYWLTVIVLPLLFHDVVEYASGALESAVLIALGCILVELVVYTHEMGHIAAGWRYGMPASLITLSPLGGLAHLMARPPSPRADIVVSLAGPAVHLPWVGVTWLLLHFEIGTGALRPDSWTFPPVWFALELLFRINGLLALFNLLPFFPLDGGRVFRALLAFRLHPNRASLIAAYVGMAGAVAILVYGLVAEGIYGTVLVFLAISNAIYCWQELLAARHSDGPYSSDDIRKPWQTDPDAWKTGAGAAAADDDDVVPRAPRRGGRVARFFGRLTGRGRDREEEPAAAAREEAATESEVDRILARVSEVGMAGLTDAERRTLERASRALRTRRSGR